MHKIQFTKNQVNAANIIRTIEYLGILPIRFQEVLLFHVVTWDGLKRISFTSTLQRNHQHIFPVILCVDSHKTHLDRKLNKFCIRLRNILISLYTNATRIHQDFRSIFLKLRCYCFQ